MRKINSILLVDDDPINNFLTYETIIRSGLCDNIHIAANGLAALNLLQENFFKDSLPDLILLDINMPVMDGYEFLQEYENTAFFKTDIKIILLSTVFRAAELEILNRNGYKDYLSKPLCPVRLKSLLFEPKLGQACLS
jgi:CheY-like chemotaxis protein